MEPRKKLIIIGSVVLLIIIIVGVVFFMLRKRDTSISNPTPVSFEPGTASSTIPRPVNSNGTGTFSGSGTTSSATSSTGTVPLRGSNPGPGGTGTGSTPTPSTSSNESPDSTGVGASIPVSTDGQAQIGSPKQPKISPVSGPVGTVPTQGLPTLIPSDDASISATTDPINNIPVVTPPVVNASEGTLVLRPLPNDDPATTDVNERDEEMKKRVLDEVWRKWELDPRKVISEKDRQRLFGEFASIKNNITSARELTKSKNLLDSVKLQNVELADALHDCKIIRSASASGHLSTDTDYWDRVKAQFLTNSLKKTFNPSISIIGTAEKHPPNDSFWNAFDQIMDSDDLPGRGADDTNADRQPQIPQARNVAGLLNQDQDKTLFCKLPIYFLTFWAPDKLTGSPIGCYKTNILGNLGTVNDKETHPNFYDINISEIFYNPGNTGL